MPYLYYLEPERGIVFQYAVGPVDDLRLSDEVERACLPSEARQIDVLCDYRRANTERLTEAGIREAARLLSSRPEAAPRMRWAVIANDASALDFARQLATWTDDPRIQARAFGEPDAARAWLGLPSEQELPSPYALAKEFPPGLGLLPG